MFADLSGATRTGPVQLRDWDWDFPTTPLIAEASMRLFIPAGYLPEATE